jgi:hypothetical protein
MSPLAIIAIVLAVLIVVCIIGGVIAVRRRARLTEGQMREHIAAADRALEAARAADKGWDVLALEEAARKVLADQAPDFRYDTLNLVLVDDKPGTEDDRAEFLASGREHLARVRVIRHGDNWLAELIT